MKRLAYLLCLVPLLLFAADALAVTIPTVPVGNAGNANDPLTGNVYGGVNYNYRIGTTEVTNAQYVEFLNAKAASDPLGLYNGAMSYWVWGGITQSGVDGSYTYATKTDMSNKPVNFVSWYDSIRFANWLHNGQGNGDTENGAYTLGVLNPDGTPVNGDSVTRNPSAKWWLPSEDEWYKAAYHQPASQGGDLDSYWLYPTASNSSPTMATANGAGDITNPGINVANYSNYNVGGVGNLTTVGSAGPLSASFYGTADQAGNVWEWNEDLVMPSRYLRGLRGGAWWDGYMASYYDGTLLLQGEAGQENEAFGFRVATVPEPSTFVLAALGVLVLAGLRKGRRSIGNALVLLVLVAFSADALAVTIPTVPVGDTGNANDPLSGNLYGGVNYDYRIGTTEVTNAQYAAFLNQKAKSDPLALYNTLMGNEARGGITRSGLSGAFTYAPRANMADKPVNYVSWYDSIRFANWLNNGQGDGSTEHGSYTLGALSTNGTPINGLSITRNAGATWFLPSENEWYKAAYHQPSAQGGDVDDYWFYATRSNTPPTEATTNGVGDIANPGANVANYSGGADWNGLDANLTTVGSAGPLSTSYYGTADQGGNLMEWIEDLQPWLDDILHRGVRGENYWSDDSFQYRSSDFPADHSEPIGFRVAMVPEPSTILLLSCGVLGALAIQRRLTKARRLLAIAIITLLASAPRNATAAPITVPVGDSGNPSDQDYSGGQFGAVPYGYRIAIHEVTNAEYAAFLNSKVSIYYDPFYFASLTFNDSKSLLNESMLYDSRGGMTVVNLPTPCYSGGGFCPPPSIPYFQARANMGDKPVNFVSWYDALRYANWLNNGPYGSTETGAYTLGQLGAGGIPLDPNAITRNPGATWVLPNEDEWYKAAYYQPAANGGDTDGYWLSPTRSNITSAVYATANSTGNVSNPGANVMNESGANWYGLTGNVTTVGSAGPLSASYYGTFDQGGNVQEWLESVASGGRIVRGGSWDGAYNIGFRADQRTILSATYEGADVGFRIAQLVPVPEPSTLALAAVGALGFLMSLRRRAA